MFTLQADHFSRKTFVNTFRKSRPQVLSVKAKNAIKVRKWSILRPWQTDNSIVSCFLKVSGLGKYLTERVIFVVYTSLLLCPEWSGGLPTEIFSSYKILTDDQFPSYPSIAPHPHPLPLSLSMLTQYRPNEVSESVHWMKEKKNNPGPSVIQRCVGISVDVNTKQIRAYCVKAHVSPWRARVSPEGVVRPPPTTHSTT